MAEHIDELRSAVDELTKSIDALGARMALLEGWASGVTDRGPPLPMTEGGVGEVSSGGAIPSRASLAGVLAIVGRTLLVLGGAFLLRAVTDWGTLPQTAGVVVGLVYSVAWIAVADRVGARGSILSASSHGVAAALMAYPLLWETTSKLGVLPSGVTAALLAAVTGALLWVAWRRDLHAVAWTATAGCLITSIGLIFATGSMEAFTAPVLLLGGATVWLAYSRRRWHIMRWPAAFAANCCVLQMVWLAGRTGTAGRFGDISITWVQVLAVGLVVEYLGSFAMRTLVRQREVTLFEVLQSAGALVVGFGGAAHVANAVGSGRMALGPSALIAGSACYAVAFAFVRRRLGVGGNFLLWAWLALILTLLGSYLVVASKEALSLVWIGLALAAAALGGRYDRITLRAHSAVYALAAGWLAGLGAASILAFTEAAPEPWPTLTFTTLGLTTACYVLLVVTQMGRTVTWLQRLPRFAILCLWVPGVGGVAVVILSELLTPASADPAPHVVAAIRSGVLAVSAIALAAVGRRSQMTELSWLVYPVLLAGAAKLLLEDLGQGQPLAVFLGFAFFGIALIAAPHLLRTHRE